MSQKNSNKDNIFFPEAEFNQKAVKLISQKELSYLKQKTLNSERNRYRLCLHSDTNHLTQEMIICLKGSNYFRTHKHPNNYSESYFMIEGIIDIYLFDDTGILLEKVNLNALNGPFYYRLSKPIFHLVRPKTEWTIYHEVATGPFNKSNSIIYADFAPREDSKPKIIEEYIRKIEIND